MTWLQGEWEEGERGNHRGLAGLMLLCCGLAGIALSSGTHASCVKLCQKVSLHVFFRFRTKTHNLC